MAQETRTIQTIKQPYQTKDGTKLYLGTSTEVEVDSNGKYIPNSAIVTLRLYNGGILGTDYKEAAKRGAGEPWQLLKDGNNNTIAGIDLQKTLADRNSSLNKNLNNHISNALQAPQQGVPAGTVNDNKQSSSNAALGLPPTTGTARPDGTPDGSQQQDPIDPNDISVPDAPDVRSDYTNSGGVWAYPKEIGTNGQDYIKFEIIQYEPRKISPNSQTGALLSDRPSTESSKGTIILPIQPSITDMNTVDWNDVGVNPLDLGLTGFALEIFAGQGNQAATNYIDYLGSQLQNAGFQQAAVTKIAQNAASTQGLLSRVTGAVVNNNLELLFNGPQLRPFNFTFNLSPRGQTEADTVKGIIRAFKEAMAVKVASSQLFLKAPNVFKISYVLRGSGEHPSLNKIKLCALQSCSVDYTPNGSYATFADGAATMVSYNLALKFQELEPVTSKDYDKDYKSIGY